LSLWRHPFAAPRASAQEFSLRAAHYFKEDHPWNKGLVYFAKRVDEESKGRVKVAFSTAESSAARRRRFSS
jgi:TRAP-type C4-dicarboxylate transport system substrate-binding protein